MKSVHHRLESSTPIEGCNPHQPAAADPVNTLGALVKLSGGWHLAPRCSAIDRVCVDCTSAVAPCVISTEICHRPNILRAAAPKPSVP